MQTHPFSLFFSSRRVQISGFVEDYPVPAITVDTATDVSVVSHAWLMSHPALRSVTIQPVPPTAVALRAANGSSLNVLGFVVFSLTLGTITHDVEALVVPSLGPDSTHAPKCSSWSCSYPLVLFIRHLRTKKRYAGDKSTAVRRHEELSLIHI